MQHFVKIKIIKTILYYLQKVPKIDISVGTCRKHLKMEKKKGYGIVYVMHYITKKKISGGVGWTGIYFGHKLDYMKC